MTVVRDEAPSPFAFAAVFWNPSADRRPYQVPVHLLVYLRILQYAFDLQNLSTTIKSPPTKWVVA